MRYLRSKRGLGGFAVLVAVAAVTLLVVLPALATSSAIVQPPSTAGVTPVDVSIGGNATCANVFPKVGALPNLQPYFNNNPSSGQSSATGTTFTLSITSSGNAGQRLAITSNPAVAIAGVAVNGGTDNDAYDYTGLDYPSGVAAGWVSGDSNLHAPMKNANQAYTISHLNICYRLLASISGKVFNDADGSGSATQAGIGPAAGEIRIFDNTTKKFSDANTAADGTFSSSQPIGDSYTVCAKLPSGYATQSVPTGTSCGSAQGYAAAGYAFALGSGGSSTNNFGFQSLRTISGQIYSDNNLNGTYDPNGTLTPHDAALATGWTVSLYDTSSGTTFVKSGTSDVHGAYTFQAAIKAGDAYRLCLSSPAGTWVQTEPRPGAATTAACPVGGQLPWAAAFTGAGDVSQNFGNAMGGPCSSITGMGSTTNGSTGTIVALMPKGSDANGGCLKQNTFAFASGVDPGNDNKNYVGVALGDPTQTTFAPVVEKITFPDPLTADGSGGAVPTYTGIEYIAGSVTTPTTMKQCAVSADTLLDPGNSGDYGSGSTLTDMFLASDYTKLRTAEAGAGGVTGHTDPLPAGQTACLISITITGAAGDNPPGSLEALVYTSADSQAWPH
jgi:hypothetical protein